MKKFLVSVMIIASMIIIFSLSAFADEVVNQDTNIHEITGGLYSLAAAVNLYDKPDIDIKILNRYFMNAPANAKVSRNNNAIWVGVPVGKYAPARSFLRSHAQELGITDAPGGYSWMSGDFAWLKAAEVSKKSLKPIALKASKGTGKDSEIIFFSTPGQNSWWQAKPDFTQQAARQVLKQWQVSDAPKLYAPSGIAATSIYEEVRPLPVRKSGKMHVGSNKSDDMSIAVGDVMFSPIPNTGQEY